MKSSPSTGTGSSRDVEIACRRACDAAIRAVSPTRAYFKGPCPIVHSPVNSGAVDSVHASMDSNVSVQTRAPTTASSRAQAATAPAHTRDRRGVPTMTAVVAPICQNDTNRATGARTTRSRTDRPPPPRRYNGLTCNAARAWDPPPRPKIAAQEYSAAHAPTPQFSTGAEEGLPVRHAHAACLPAPALIDDWPAPRPSLHQICLTRTGARA